MTQPKGTSKRRRHDASPSKTPSNYISGIGILGLVAVTIADLLSTGTVPNIVYFGLIGASLGAKWDDIGGWFGGKK